MSHLPRDDYPMAEGTRAQVRIDRRRGLRRFFGLTALGTLLPGAGLSLAGRRRLGWTLLGAFVVGVATAGVVIARMGLVKAALSLAVRPNLLIALSIGIAVAAVVWCASIALTARQTRPASLTRLQKVTTTGFALVMCLVVLLPAAQVVRYVNTTRDVVGTLFTGKHVAPSADGVVHAKPIVTKADPWADTPRVNVLLLGSDAGADRIGVRTDSMIVASINTKTGDAVLFGIPRNLQNVPFPKHDPLHRLYPNGFNCGGECLMNAVWTVATDHPDLFPGDTNPGLTATRDALSEVLGLTIDNTVIIDLRGFQSLVNAMGGVDVNVKERVPIGGEVRNGRIVNITGWINPGKQHLDGYHALWYARSRATTDDFSRMRRQRCVVGALVSQVNPVSMLEKYPALAAVAKQNIQLDMRQDELPAWVELIQRVQNAQIRSLPFTEQNTNVANPDFARIHRLVQSAIAVRSASPTPSATASTSPTMTSPTPSATASTSPSATSKPKPGKTTSPAPVRDQLVSLSEAC